MKIAVFFPGIGYRFERPLLRETMAIAEKRGYEILCVDYNGFDGDAKHNLDAAVETAVNQTERILDGKDWSKFDGILFVGKSIGTSVAAIYAHRHRINCMKILLTPIPQTFSVEIENAIAFYGTSDPWISRNQVEDGCRKNSIPLSIFDGANHSLICGDESKDRKTLDEVLKEINRFIKE